MKRHGFTLVELVVVILILGILAGVAAPRFLDTSGDATDASVRQTLAVVRDAIELYAAQNGRLPPHNGAATGDGSLNDELEDFLRGGIPASPIGPQDNSVGVATDDEDTDTVGLPDTSASQNAWVYNTETGTFISGSNETTNAGDGTTYDQL